MARAFTLPDTPLGAFVRKNYAPKMRKGAFRKLKKGGFVPPAELARKAREERIAKLIPRDFIGYEGVSPAYRFRPRVDESKFVIGTNAAGRFFTRPRTELEGLDVNQRASIGRFDERTNAQVGQIEGAYQGLASDFNNLADQSAARLGSLGSLIGTGHSQAQVAGAARTSEGEQNIGQAQTDVNKDIASAQSAVAIGQSGLRAPAALEAGQRAVTGFRTDRANSRFEAIEGMRAANAEAAAEADRFARELAAQIRGQDMQAIVQQISQTGQNSRAQVAAATADADREANLQVELAQLRQDLEIAVLNNDTDLAQTIQQQIGAYERELLKEDGKNGRAAAGGSRNMGKVRDNYRKSLLKDLTNSQTTPDGVNQTILNPNADLVPAILDGLNRGLTPAGVVNTLRTIQGLGNFGSSRQSRTILYRALMQAGMSGPNADKTVKKITGRRAVSGPRRP